MNLRTALTGLILLHGSSSMAGELLAAVAKVEITDHQAGPVNDPCFAKVLLLKKEATTLALITVDAVAIGEIGRIGNGFLQTVRTELQRDLGIEPSSVIINASHCHGIVRGDTAQLVIAMVKKASEQLVPVHVGQGSGLENRISENRRLRMKDGSEVDMRRAYSMPLDSEVASVGPIDPQVGVVKLDKADGSPFARLYTFACHPIMNPPSKGNSADYPGFASKVIEDALGQGAVALFVQGCGGDINPVRYKEVSRPADAEPLGTMLGANVMSIASTIPTQADGELKVMREIIKLPRAADYENRIAAIQAEQSQLLAALKPTNISFKAFLPLLIQQKVFADFPSHYSQSYLHDRSLEKKSIDQLDADNQALVSAYLHNVQVMEKLTRLNTNLALLKRHLAQTQAAGDQPLETEVCAFRIGDFKMITFPGELTVQVGLNIKQAAKDPNTFVAGYTNGYIYYTPTMEQRGNTGYAQEDCDTLVAPEWQKLFQAKALELLRQL